jgi:hypothetical protein
MLGLLEKMEQRDRTESTGTKIFFFFSEFSLPFEKTELMVEMEPQEMAQQMDYEELEV